MEAWEKAILQVALAAGANGLTEVLKPIGTGRPTDPLRGRCGTRMTSVGQRTKTLTTLRGQVPYHRRLCVCPDGGPSLLAGDRSLNIEHTGFSPGVRRWMVRAGRRTSWGDAEEDWAAYAHVQVSCRDIERIAEAMGREIEPWRCRREDPAPSTPIPILYVRFDGTAVPMRRKELQGRRGKQPDGSAKGREVKVGWVFTQTHTNPEGFPVRDEHSTTYVAGIESRTLFGERIDPEARQRGLDQAHRVVILTDGATYNKTMVPTHFPSAQHIIDWYQAREHLHLLADLLNASARLTVESDGRDQGAIETLLAEAQTGLPRTGKRRREALKQGRSFQKNTPFMRYADFRRQGLFIGSGVIEAGGRTVVAQRLKQAGMFWSLRGAHAIRQARCCLLSGRFDRFWDDRAAA